MPQQKKKRVSLAPSGDRIPITSWKKERAGAEYVGTYRGMRAGKFGPLADFEDVARIYNGKTEDVGAAVFGVPTALYSQLSRIRRGAEEVSILYNGKVESEKTGQLYHSFEVSCNEEDQLDEPVEAPRATGYDRAIRGSESGGFRGGPRNGGAASRPIRQAAVAEPEEGPEEEEAPAPAPAKKSAARGRTLKSVFEGLDN